MQLSFWPDLTKAPSVRRAAINAFIGFRPPPPPAREARQIAQDLIAEHALDCWPRPTEVLHGSLHGLWATGGEASIFEAGARAALPLVRTRRFEVVFDRVASFGPNMRYGKITYPLVLLADERSEVLIRELWDDAGNALERRLGVRAKQIKPHVTIAYPERQIAEQAIRPIRWTVDEIVLIRSLRGQTRHIVLQRQALRRPN